MTRWSATLLVFAVCSAAVHADVTIVQKTTVEGGAAAAIAGVTALSPTITIRIKGMMGRTDVDRGATVPVAANLSTIVDAGTGQVIILDHNQKTARISTPGVKPVPMMADRGVKPTGKSKTIDGLKCDEYGFTTSSDLDIAGNRQLPFEIAARQRRDERVIGPDLAASGFIEEGLKDLALVIKGSVWLSRDAPGYAEYHEYQKALASAGLPSVAMDASGMTMTGSERLTAAMQGVEGLPVLTVISLSIEGTGQVSEINHQKMATTKMTTKVQSVKTDAIDDAAFKVPEGYQIIK